MNSSVQITTKNGRLIARISLIFFILANFIWLFLPFLMAGLWSLVDPAKPWSYQIGRASCRERVGKSGGGGGL